MAWECFMVAEFGLSRYSLRRFRWGDYHEDGERCPRDSTSQYSIHNASVVVGDGPTLMSDPDEDGRKWLAHIPVVQFCCDTRWPTHCDCGYEFRQQDEWQVNADPYYRLSDGRNVTMKELPIGAMFNAEWHAGRPAWTGPDGLSLHVKLPPGGPHDFWIIDGPASNGGHWTRTGVPPKISVTPSISTPKYHGFLGSNTAPAIGWLSDPL